MYKQLINVIIQEVLNEDGISVIAQEEHLS